MGNPISYVYDNQRGGFCSPVLISVILNDDWDVDVHFVTAKMVLLNQILCHLFVAVVKDVCYFLTVNKQLADKERVAAALENNHLLEVVNRCLMPREPWDVERGKINKRTGWIWMVFVCVCVCVKFHLHAEAHYTKVLESYVNCFELIKQSNIDVKLLVKTFLLPLWLIWKIQQ